MKKKKYNKGINLKNYTAGITLIALLITIIVLLILAGVTIAMLSGENGILNKANEAKNSTEQAKIDEEQKLIDAAGVLDIQIGDVVVPKGFYFVGGSRKTGLVISDKKEDENKGVNSELQGNQFVWIPVDGHEIELNRYTFKEDAIPVKQDQTPINAVDYDNTIGEGNYQELEISPYSNITSKNINNFKESVTKNKGYYIARYEASVNNETGKVGSKKGTVWNNIGQIEAANASKNMYTDTEKYGVTSDLMNSYAWDTAIVYIQKYGTDNKYSRKQSINRSLKDTGTIGDVQCNINDMASNCIEWNTETSSYSLYNCVARGGLYISYTSIHSDKFGCSSLRDNMAISINMEYNSFRPILYINN